MIRSTPRNLCAGVQRVACRIYLDTLVMNKAITESEEVHQQQHRKSSNLWLPHHKLVWRGFEDVVWKVSLRNGTSKETGLELARGLSPNRPMRRCGPINFLKGNSNNGRLQKVRPAEHAFGLWLPAALLDGCVCSHQILSYLFCWIPILVLLLRWLNLNMEVHSRNTFNLIQFSIVWMV